MYLTSVLSVIYTISLAGLSSAAAPKAPVLHPAFQVELYGPVLPSIPFTGGKTILHQITGGKISGPTFNATVTGGLAYPLAYGDKGNVRVTQTLFYGNTSDGGSFLFQNSGVGDSTTSFSRVKLEAGPQFADITTKFIIVEVFLHENGKRVTMDAFYLLS